MSLPVSWFIRASSPRRLISFLIAKASFIFRRDVFLTLAEDVLEIIQENFEDITASTFQGHFTGVTENVTPIVKENL